jgi:hypothetical protein
MWYFRKAPLEQPLAGPAMVLFLFFSSNTSHALILPSWSMAALASLLYDKLWERKSCGPTAEL